MHGTYVPQNYIFPDQSPFLTRCVPGEIGEIL